MSDQEPLPGEWPEPAELPVTATVVRVDVSADFSEWLAAREAYPDGIPEYWDAEMLAEELGRQYGSAREMLDDWNVELELQVTLLDDQERRVLVEFSRDHD